MTLLVAGRTVIGYILKSLVRNIKGQVSIFFATTVVVLITFIAFIVNIGLFVKAKINLQNAVDAAAWSGAAVQARQLTNIAYLNWEMRNIYKEWLFKYYVLGNSSLDVIADGPTNPVNWRMNSIAGSQEQFGRDAYNFPSICINFQTPNSQVANICKIYSLPGLPVFNAVNAVGADQITTSFTNSLASAKMEACGRRSALNFLTANMWAYNVTGSPSLTSIAPEIAGERPGAFPSAFELALRIRNLERFVNRTPIYNGMCKDKGDASSPCNETIEDLQNENSPSNERPVKAYFAAYRNLGNEVDSEMKASLTITELPPKAVVSGASNSLSNLLIPTQYQKKFYLDLKLMTLNLATFFTTFASADINQVDHGLGGPLVGEAGRCDATKVALPVPGYPLGFVKSPRVLTYYAVKGTANWVGLFNPFQIQGQGIKLTAYAAAKPFGGRIGPMLFDVFQESTLVFPRDSQLKKTSSGNIIGFNYQLDDIISWNGSANANVSSGFVSGAPLPLDPNFWLQNVDNAVGGWTTDSNIVFGLPNIVYDYATSASNPDEYYSSDKISLMTIDGNLSAGLYNADVLSKFRQNLPQLDTSGNRPLTPDEVDRAIKRVRGPTLYEANNYLIPTPEELNSELGVVSFGATNGTYPGSGTYKMDLFAPLFSDIPGGMYPNYQAAIGVLDTYLNNQRPAVEKFRDAMNNVSNAIADLRSPNGDLIGAAAAAGFSDPDAAGLPTCKSLAGKFIFFFLGNNANNVLFRNTDCVDPDSGATFKSMQESLAARWADGANGIGDIYSSEYTVSDDIKSRVFTAYRPGPLHDASPFGVWKKTVGGPTDEKMWRNFYSTKFIEVGSLLKGGNYDATRSGFPIISEGNSSHGEIDELKITHGGGEFENPLDLTGISVDISNVFN